MRKYNIAVVIGRFQPIHNGHLSLFNKAMSMADEVVVLAGSANKAPNIKDPFTFAERKYMIESAILSTDRAKAANCHKLDDLKRFLEVIPVVDYPYNDERWAAQLQAIIEDKKFPGHETSIVLIGHIKDESSFYLKMFPQWDLVDVEFGVDVHATDIRKALFSEGFKLNDVAKLVPPTTLQYLSNFISFDSFKILKEEYRYIEEYKKLWEQVPYAPTFLTADAVVIQQGHILLVERGHMPGKGLLALPGGFVNPTEYIKDAAIRELREETKLKVPEKVLYGSIIASKIFDKPSRSLRGRTVTEAFLIHLKDFDQGLPKVKGSDDAAKADWYQLSVIKEEMFFEDHWHIIQDMVGRL
jgi:bifunctional NMN adenylyltransferase/nudix hydrolase